MYGVIRELGVGITGQKLVRAHTINSIAIVWLLISATGPVRDAYENRLTLRGREAAVVLLSPVTQSLSILIIIIAILICLDNMGFNITTLLVGLGVGGIAVALAQQKPMEDVFAYTDTRTFPDYLEVAEELNMKILDILARVGTTLALPGQTLYMEPLPEMT